MRNAEYFWEELFIMSGERTIERTDKALTRGIQPWHVSLIALGGIIGSCYFLGLGLTLHEMGAGAVLISYTLAGITIYGVMQSFKELLVNVPRRGSFVSYTRDFMGDTASAGVGWAFWANWVCYIPSEALAVATFTNALFFHGQDNTPWHMQTFIIGVITLAILTLINVYHVKWFGHVESIMAIVKIIAIILFCLAAIGIWLGLLNSGTSFSFTGEDGMVESAVIEPGFIGTSALLAEEGVSTFQQLFPGGGMIIIIMMIWTLVNFQGSEIVGLSAAETQNPEVNVPLACKRVAYRIVLIYLVPIFILSLIMPYFVATMDDSVFAQALVGYGFTWGARVFEVVTLIAAFSCANSGFYGTVRSVYGLSSEGLAPKFLSDLNKFNVPQKATITTLVGIWVVFVFSFLIQELGFFGGEEGNHLYIALIGIAGFTGTLCWVGILWSQVVFRKRLKDRGYNVEKELKVKASFYPGLIWMSIVIQMLAMILLVFEEGDGIPIFLLSMDIIIIPIVIYQVQKWRGRIRQVTILGADEVTFDMKFPIQPGTIAEKKKQERDKKEAEGDHPTGGSVLAVLLIALTATATILSLVTIQLNPLDLERGNIFTADGMGTVWALTVICMVIYIITFWGVFRLNKIRKK